MVPKVLSTRCYTKIISEILKKLVGFYLSYGLCSQRILLNIGPVDARHTNLPWYDPRSLLGVHDDLLLTLVHNIRELFAMPKPYT